MKSIKSSGFTLIELMTVVAIVGLLAALAVSNYRTFVSKARRAEAKAMVPIAMAMLSSYAGEEGTFVPPPGLSCATLLPAPNDCIDEVLNNVGFSTTCEKARYQYRCSPSITATAASIFAFARAVTSICNPCVGCNATASDIICANEQGYVGSRFNISGALNMTCTPTGTLQGECNRYTGAWTPN